MRWSLFSQSRLCVDKERAHCPDYFVQSHAAGCPFDSECGYCKCLDYLTVTCIFLFICRKNSIKQPVYEIVSV